MDALVKPRTAGSDSEMPRRDTRSVGRPPRVYAIEEGRRAASRSAVDLAGERMRCSRRPAAPALVWDA